MIKQLNFNRNKFGRTSNVGFRLNDENDNHTGVFIEVGERFKRAEQERLGERIAASYSACADVPVKFLEGIVIAPLISACKGFMSGDVTETELRAMFAGLGIVDEQAKGAGA